MRSWGCSRDYRVSEIDNEWLHCHSWSVSWWEQGCAVLRKIVQIRTVPRVSSNMVSMPNWRLISLPMKDWTSSVMYPYTRSKNSHAILRLSSTSYLSRQTRKRVWLTIISSTAGWWVMSHRNLKYWKNQPSSKVQLCKIVSWLGDSVLCWFHRLVERAMTLELTLCQSPHLHRFTPLQTSKFSFKIKSNATASHHSHSRISC